MNIKKPVLVIFQRTQTPECIQGSHRLSRYGLGGDPGSRRSSEQCHWTRLGVPCAVVVSCHWAAVRAVLCMAFEITPEGIMRESEVDRSQSITPQTGKKLNLMITAALLQPHCPKKRINLDCKIRLLQLVIISTLLGGGAAIANVLEEVTVTAQKREQNSQDVGIAMTVMTGDFTR